MVKPFVVDDQTLVVDLERDMVVLSTAGCPKIFSEIRYIVFRSVPSDFSVTDLDSYCVELSSSLGLDYSKTTIFLTAVDVKRYSHSAEVYNCVKAEAFVTLGIDKPVCIDTSSQISSQAIGVGTINVAVVVDKPLSRLGLVDLLRTVSEVKAVAVALGGPACVSGSQLGTASDAVAVAAPPGNERFAGPATDVGFAATLAVLKALSQLLKDLGIGRYVATSMGFASVEDVVNASIEVYREAAIPCLSEADVRDELMKEIRSAVEDFNITVLVRGAKLAEAALSLDLVPGVDVERYRRDSPDIVVDELLGKALAEYINGFRGLLAYYWVERLKEHKNLAKLASLPPITDDLAAAFIGAVLSRIYDKYSRYCKT